MPAVQLDGRTLTDWAGFHQTCKQALGFPAFYGGNMDAWIDCLSGLRDDDGMSAYRLAPDEMLQIQVLHSDVLRREAPEILSALEECTAEVNQLYTENGKKPAIGLVLR